MTRFFRLANEIIRNYFKDELKKDIIIYSLIIDNIISNDDTYHFKIRIREDGGTK